MAQNKSKTISTSTFEHRSIHTPNKMAKTKRKDEAPSSVPSSKAKDAAVKAAEVKEAAAAVVDVAAMKTLKNNYSYAGNLFLFLSCVCTVLFAGYHAWEIRMYAIRTYGLVIHEFDPWFNYRATEYLKDHGIYEFFHWFDYKVWYPLGRPVGTTIYPGMQLTSVAIWRVLNEIVGHTISLNDVCCYVPTWGGVAATFFLSLLTKECSDSWTAGAFAATIMAIVPAHIMRSVGGGYDNESIALTAMCMTFYLWVRSLRADPRVKDGRRTFDSIYYGILAGFAYVYMAAAWGGFIFVINLIAFHAGALVLLGRYSSKLHTSYTLFFLVGTIGAMQIPVIGMRPLQSLEQISGLIVFLAFQVLEYVEQKRRANKLSIPQVFVERVKATLMVCIPLGLFTYYLFNIGHFGPLGARIRGLFVKHTRTGNPLVDSVAEHQPASAAAYRQYLHHIFDIVPYGFALAVCRIPMTTDANFFLVAYAGVAYYFANKMARLIILLGPISSALGGMALGFAADQLIVGALGSLLAPGLGIDEQLLEDSALKEALHAEQEKGKKGVVAGVVGDGSWADKCTRVVRTSAVVKAVHNVYRNPIACLARVALGVYMVRSGGNVCTCHGVKCTDVPWFLFLFLSGFFLFFSRSWPCTPKALNFLNTRIKWRKA